jgi:NADPH2:quinone reductase
VRALVTTPDTKFGLALREAPDPVPAADQVLVEVRHASLNYGDVGYAATMPEGIVQGWDSAGVVVKAAADGSGPAVGTKIVGWAVNGAWAELRALKTDDIAVVPEDVDLAVAAALPTAGVSALRALRASGELSGKRVLITGASGGVGRYAIQLAALDGAHVIALSRSQEGLAELGAKEVVSSLDNISAVDVVLDNVGGPTLVRAWELLAPGGVLQSIGWTSLEPATFPPYATVGAQKSLQAFTTGGAYRKDLEHLLGLFGAGKLSVDVGWRGSWQKFDDAATALVGRQVTGKAVVDID